MVVIINGKTGGVAAENGTGNDSQADVIGNKEDAAFSNGVQNPSLIGHSKAAYYHVHNSSKVYPRDADAVTITAGTGSAWAEGAKTEIIPASTIDKLFDMHWTIISNVSAADAFVLKLYTGGAGSEVFWGECAFERDSGFLVLSRYSPVQGEPIPANTRISASLLCSDGDGATCTVKVYTHIYPDVT